MTAAVTAETTFTPAMLDGHACVLCGTDYTVPGCPAHASVGFIEGRQVFACDDPRRAYGCALLLTSKTRHTCQWHHRPDMRPAADGHLTLVYTDRPGGEREMWSADVCARHRRSIVKAARQLHRHLLLVNEWEPLPDEDPDELPLRERQ